jgi:hypothetical protein
MKRRREKRFRLNAGFEPFTDGCLDNRFVIPTTSQVDAIIDGQFFPDFPLEFEAEVYRLGATDKSGVYSAQSLRTGYIYTIRRDQILGYSDYKPKPDEPMIYQIKGRLCIKGKFVQNAKTCWIQ